MSVFKYDTIIQEYITIIVNEGRIEELIKACDFYHFEIPNNISAFEWGLTFGEYIGKFRYGEHVFRFMGDEKTALYFIGSSEEVKKKISNIL